MKTRILTLVLALVVGALALATKPALAQVSNEGCAYWNYVYNVNQDAYNYYMYRCYTDGAHYCDLADAHLVAMGNAGNMLDWLGCY